MGRSKKSKNQIKIDKEKIKMLFQKQKVIQAQNKEILKDVQLISVNQISKNLEKKIEQEKFKKIKKIHPKEIIVEQEVQTGHESPLNKNLFEMKAFQSSLILDDQPQFFNEHNLLHHYQVEEQQFDTMNPFQKNGSFIIESDDDIQIEEDPVELDRDEHLRSGEAQENLILKEINELSSKFYSKQNITHSMSKENPFFEKRKLLPISEKEYEIQENIYQNLVTVICGSTGSGKSTQIPQFLYEFGYGKFGKIGITQPRRIAAISLSQRVEEEQQAQNQQLIGYQVRYEKSDKVEKNKIKFMTDGILLNEMMSDFLLKDYSIIIIDEAHERKLATDILIGLLSRVVNIRAQMALDQYKKKDKFEDIEIHPLRLIIISATLRVDDFIQNQKLFEIPPPLIKIQAKTFPVNIYYNKITPEDPFEDMINKVRKIHLNLPKGGILVFLTGKEEVNSFCKQLHENMKYIRSVKLPDEEKIINGEIDPEQLDDLEDEIFKDDDSFLTEEFENIEDSLVNSETQKKFYYENETYIILPLYSKLPISQQQKIFEENPNKRKIIITTNVAETSLTIDNLKYVIDSGKEKVKTINQITGLVKYSVENITKSSAKQRKGRVGRTNVGYCYRIYSPAVYNRFHEFKDPEIVYLPLDYVLIQICKIGIKQPLQFPFPTQPSKEHLYQSYGEILELGLIKEHEQTVELTELGEALSYIPMQPKISVMILRLRKSGMCHWGIILSGLLNFEEIFINEKEFNRDSKLLRIKELGPLINSNSDLITQSNILIQFFYQKNKSFFNSQKILKEKQIIKEISQFVKKYRLNDKIFREFLFFIFQNLLIFKNMFSNSEYQQLLLNLTTTSKVSKLQEKQVIKMIALSFPKNICKKRTIYVEENKMKQRFETQDFREANFFSNSFVKKNETFYLYQTILQIDEKYYLHNITKITDFSLLYEIDLQRIGHQQIQTEKRIQFNDSFITLYDKKQDKVYAHYRYYFGPFKWETPQFLFDIQEDSENRELLFLIALIKGQIFVQLKSIEKMYSFKTENLNEQMVKTHKGILTTVNYFKEKGIFNKEKLKLTMEQKSFRNVFLGLIASHFKTQVELKFGNLFSIKQFIMIITSQKINIQNKIILQQIHQSQVVSELLQQGPLYLQGLFSLILKSLSLASLCKQSQTY